MAARYQPDRKCPVCNGAGVIEIPDGHGACADTTDYPCGCNGGSLSPGDEGYAEAPRWRMRWTDPLVELASERRLVAHVRYQTPRYLAARRNAMRPVVSRLRLCDMRALAARCATAANAWRTAA